MSFGEFLHIPQERGNIKLKTLNTLTSFMTS